MKRQYRLRRNNDFQRVRQLGKIYASPLMVLAFLRNGLEDSRFGFVVSKRLGNAVKRNKIKRRMREIARTRLVNIEPGFDIVIIARKPVAQAQFKEMEKGLERLLKKARLIKKQ